MKTLDEIIGIKTKHRIQLTTEELKEMLIKASEQAFNAAKRTEWKKDNRMDFMFVKFGDYLKEII